MTVVTDHKPNVSLLKAGSNLNPRPLRFAEKLMGRVKKTVWKEGVSIGNADGLSRLEEYEVDEDRQRKDQDRVSSPVVVTAGFAEENFM